MGNLMSKKERAVVVFCTKCRGQFYAVSVEYLNSDRWKEIKKYVTEGHSVEIFDRKDVTMKACQCQDKEGGEKSEKVGRRDGPADS